MENQVEHKAKFFSEGIKLIILVGSIVVTVTLYVHSTFATNSRVDSIETRISDQEKRIEDQKKISCLIAIAVNVEKEKLPRMCSLE